MFPSCADTIFWQDLQKMAKGKASDLTGTFVGLAIIGVLACCFMRYVNAEPKARAEHFRSVPAPAPASLMA